MLHKIIVMLKNKFIIITYIPEISDNMPYVSHNDITLYIHGMESVVDNYYYMNGVQLT